MASPLIAPSTSPMFNGFGCSNRVGGSADGQTLGYRVGNVEQAADSYSGDAAENSCEHNGSDGDSSQTAHLLGETNTNGGCHRFWKQGRIDLVIKAENHGENKYHDNR